MKLERCNNGHLYDSSRYGACPYCESEGLKKEVKGEDINLVEEMIDDDKTVAYWSKDISTDPVVGWLVCIEGNEKGKDYKIKSERNFIGRSEDMDICISGDNTISRKNHCSISYNPKQRNFIISPGSGNGIVYVQTDALYESRKIRSYDFIEIGESKFVFISLCGDNFDWNIEGAPPTINSPIRPEEKIGDRNPNYDKKEYDKRSVGSGDGINSHHLQNKLGNK